MHYFHLCLVHDVTSNIKHYYQHKVGLAIPSALFHFEHKRILIFSSVYSLYVFFTTSLQEQSRSGYSKCSICTFG